MTNFFEQLLSGNNEVIEPKPTSHEGIVLKHLRDNPNAGLTSMEAFSDYDMTRLAATIFCLREKGWNIMTIDKSSKNCSRYAQYKLVVK